MLAELDVNLFRPAAVFQKEKRKRRAGHDGGTELSKLHIVAASTSVTSAEFAELFYATSPLSVPRGAKRYLPQASKQLWKRDGGEPLASLLEMAGYDLPARQFHNNFFSQAISPFLGQHPQAGRILRPWKSFMTDDHTPMELSCSWSSSSPTPDVRYSVEPISLLASTHLDSFNSSCATDMVARLARQYATVDRRWFDHFNEELVVARPETLSPEVVGRLDHLSQTFLAFDLGNSSDLVLKVYFVPEMEALRTLVSKSVLVERAVKKLYPTLPSLQEPSNAMFHFIRASGSTLALETEIVAIDCVAPEDSRIKVYVRSRQTSFDSVRRVMTMDGTIKHSEQGMQALSELWYGLLAPDSEHSTSAPLPETGHRTAGILYYFEIRPGRPVPRPKVYIPVKHYGGNDLKASKALSTFLSARGQGFVDSDFLNGVRRLCSHRKLEDGLGFQTYVSCAIEKDTLAVTSYFNPEIYHPTRSY